ncbi:MAG: hypothetical protein KGH95_00400 [Thaumarchaeota archaeon]|nr:hypothetical protein [Nitrososphaerota archaeon]
MGLRCNICSKEINENDVIVHIDTTEHKDNKSKISTSGKGSDKSVANMWLKSLT